jgi:hypothetical protein
VLEEESEVRIISLWNNAQQLPDIDNLVIEFQTFIVHRKMKAKINQKKTRSYINDSLNSPNTLSYVEKPLGICR